MNATSFLIFWYMPVNGGENQTFEYLPSITKANIQDWANHSAWIQQTEHRFSALTPFTTYNVTVYVRAKGSQHVDSPYLYINVTTAEGKAFGFILIESQSSQYAPNSQILQNFRCSNGADQCQSHTIE